MPNRTARLDHKPLLSRPLITLASNVYPTSLATTAAPKTVAPIVSKLTGYDWARIIKALLLRISAEALAKRVGRSPKTVRLWEKGTRQPETSCQHEILSAYKKLVAVEPPKHNEE